MSIPNDIPKVIYLQHGGKTDLAKWVCEHLPPHETYVEPFFGGGAVLLRKARSKFEVANDVDKAIINVYRQAVENPDALAAALRICPYHEGHDWSFSDETVAGAVQAIADCRQKYAGRRPSSTWVRGDQGGAMPGLGNVVGPRGPSSGATSRGDILLPGRLRRNSHLRQQTQYVVLCRPPIRGP